MPNTIGKQSILEFIKQVIIVLLGAAFTLFCLLSYADKHIDAVTMEPTITGLWHCNQYLLILNKDNTFTKMKHRKKTNGIYSLDEDLKIFVFKENTIKLYRTITISDTVLHISNSKEDIVCNKRHLVNEQ